MIGSELISNNVIYNRKSNGSAVCLVFPVNWASQVVQKESGKESAGQCRRHGFDPSLRKIPWSRKQQPTPVFLPGDFHGQRSLMSYSLWGCNESDMTERLTHTSSIHNLLHVWCKVRTEFIISYPEHQVQHH